MMLRVRRLSFGFAIGVLSAPGLAAPNLQDGEWETTVKMEMEGMPMEMPPITSRQCLTKKDLIPRTTQPGQDCRILNQKISGNNVSWEMQCTAKEGSIRGSGNVTYEKESYQGTVSMEMESMVPKMRMNYTLRGHRVGPCK